MNLQKLKSTKIKSFLLFPIIIKTKKRKALPLKNLWSLIFSLVLSFKAESHSKSFVIIFEENQSKTYAESAKKILNDKFNIPRQLTVIINGACHAYPQSVMTFCVRNEDLNLIFINKRKLRTSYIHLLEMNEENEVQ